MLYKWLYDKKINNMALTSEGIKRFCKIATAIKKTIEIQEEIDELYPEVEKDLIEYSPQKQNKSLKDFNE